MTPSRRTWRTSLAGRARVHELRHRLTPAETKLWRHLRGGRLDGYHFRRQHPIGRFIVDFFCAERGLVIEVDGDTHAEREAYDEDRQRWLTEDKGYEIVRFSNDDVHGNLRAVLEAIRATLSRPPL